MLLSICLVFVRGLINIPWVFTVNYSTQWLSVGAAHYSNAVTERTNPPFVGQESSRTGSELHLLFLWVLNQVRFSMIATNGPKQQEKFKPERTTRWPSSVWDSGHCCWCWHAHKRWSTIMCITTKTVRYFKIHFKHTPLSVFSWCLFFQVYHSRTKSMSPNKIRSGCFIVKATQRHRGYVQKKKLYYL